MQSPNGTSCGTTVRKHIAATKKAAVQFVKNNCADYKILSVAPVTLEHTFTTVASSGRTF
jgi:hypothetical protein